MKHKKLKSTKSEVENDFENNNRIYVCVFRTNQIICINKFNIILNKICKYTFEVGRASEACPCLVNSLGREKSARDEAGLGYVG